ncbi:MAG: flavin reductase [Phycisphaeraceae bacterium]|nr:flavin reductase [Phycisphaeraceae bacterium]
MDWLPADRASIAAILDRIPNSHFILTAAHGDTRCGAHVRWVQQCARTPPMLLVAIEKGHALSAIIRDSHGFALCQVHRDERVLKRLFPAMPEHGVDPFISVPHLRTPSGAPVPLRAMSWFDCEMVRHVDIEADTEIYVGVVHHASLVQPGATVRCHCAEEPSVSIAPAPIEHASNGANGAPAVSSSNRSPRPSDSRPTLPATARGARESAHPANGASRLPVERGPAHSAAESKRPHRSSVIGAGRSSKRR